MLLELSLETSDRNSIHKQIRDALAKGIAVLVHGWEPQQAIEFKMDEIAAYRPPASQTVKWQGLCFTSSFVQSHRGIADAGIRSTLFEQKPSKREYSKQIVAGSLAEFVLANEANDRCLNCLDLPVLMPEVPAFLR